MKIHFQRHISTFPIQLSAALTKMLNIVPMFNLIPMVIVLALVLRS
jgi:hypothetical protein